MSPFILVTHGPDNDTVAIMVSAIVSCGKWFGPAADGASFISHRGGTGNLVVREPFPEILRRIREATGTLPEPPGIPWDQIQYTGVEPPPPTPPTIT